jgi:transforming growth factor-beta-induced protein
MQKRRVALLTITAGLIAAACAPAATQAPTAVPPTEAPATAAPTTAPASDDIVDTAIADGRFTTLVAAVQAAGLEETLRSAGPFTVFAPTDEAFAALPEGTVESLLLPENQQQLADILLYHVVSGEVLAADVVNLTEAETALEGQSVAIRVEDGNVFINDAQVIITDIQTSNGVIHVIDSVLLPETAAGAGTIAEVAQADGRFSTLLAALEAADLAETLAGEGPFTVFAPTDDAFAALPEGTVETLLLPENQEQLQAILLYHVVAGEVLAEQVVELESADTVGGQPVSIRVENGTVFINDAQVLITDIPASNGVIHVIDSVLLPEATAGTIAEVAAADGRFTTLLTAIEAADLSETLAGEGPFTVFAPTDEAFAALPAGTLDSLLLPENQAQLQAILLYHVVAGEVLAEQVVTLESADTVGGQSVTIRVEDGRVFVNDSEVTITDIPASNGVIHVIDAVLLPPTAADGH